MVAIVARLAVAAALSLAAHAAATIGAAQTPPGAAPAATPTPARDWAVPNGYFYTQAGAGAGGYTVADDGGVRFWAAYQRLGGPAALGFPASRRFVLDGFVYQATQAALLQWRPAADLQSGSVVLGNTFELLQQAGRDEWLERVKGIPRPIQDDGATSFEAAVRVRLGWLTEASIRERYFRSPHPDAGRAWSERDAVDLYGLPMSRPERMGPFIAQRFQRIAFQLWVDAVPGMPPPGSVTAVLGGDLLKEAGLIAGTAATPHASAALVDRPVVLAEVPVPTPGAPTPGAPTPGAPTPGATPAPRAATPVPPAASVVAGPVVQALDGTLSEYSIFLPRTVVGRGTVRFVVTNVGVLRHNLRVVGTGVDRKTADLRAGQTGQVDVAFAESGAYTVYCDIADHEALGMSLELTVEE